MAITKKDIKIAVVTGLVFATASLIVRNAVRKIEIISK